MTAVMQGIRVLEVAEHTFVPAASAILSDWGADIVKIEHVERGDAMRGLARSGLMPLGNGGVHALLEHSNRGKRSLGLDLTRPEGLDVLHRLVAISDVFLTNKLPGVVAKLGIDVDDIRAHNERIVYVRGTGYGSKGPDSDRGGYDVLGYWSRSGLAVGAKTLEVDMMPAQPAPAYGDSIGAMTIAGGIAAALLHRERSGHSPVVDVSLLAAGMWAGGASIALSQQLGVPWEQPPVVRTEIQNPLTGYFKTKDGRWITLSCLQGFHYWPDMCRVIDRPELIEDPRFTTVEKLFAHGAEAHRMVAEAFAGASFEAWRQRLTDFSGQWAPVLDSLEVVDDPQVQANGFVIESETREGVPFKLVATPVQFDGAPSATRRAPDFNEHGDAILTEDLGLAWDTVVDLKLKGVVA